MTKKIKFKKTIKEIINHLEKDTKDIGERFSDYPVYRNKKERKGSNLGWGF